MLAVVCQVAVKLTLTQNNRREVIEMENKRVTDKQRKRKRWFSTLPPYIAQLYVSHHGT